MSFTRFLILRHGETEWNALGREMGQLDSPLTSRGLAQAQLAASRVAAFRPTALYSSDLGRAVHTAQFIGTACELALRLDPRLRERHVGIFQGLTSAESARRYPQERAAYRSDQHYEIPGGESGAQRSDRALACLEELAQRHSGETLVVITHGGLLMGVLERTLDLPAGSGRRFRKHNLALNIFTRSASEWTLESWGDISHLGAALPV